MFLCRLFLVDEAEVGSVTNLTIPSTPASELVIEENQEGLLTLTQNLNSSEENTRASFHQLADPKVLEDQKSVISINQIPVNVIPKVRPDCTTVEKGASSSNKSVIGKNWNLFGTQNNAEATVINCGGDYMPRQCIHIINCPCSMFPSYSLETIYSQLQNLEIQLQRANEQNRIFYEEVMNLQQKQQMEKEEIPKSKMDEIGKWMKETREIQQVILMLSQINQINFYFAFSPNSRDPRDPFGGGGSGAGMGFVAG